MRTIQLSLNPSITDLLGLVAAGDPNAREKLWTQIYPEVRQHAHAVLANWSNEDAMSATDLTHQVFLRVDETGVYSSAPNRRYFFGIVVQAMTRVLVEEYRARRSGKRGGTRIRLSLHEVPEPEAPGSELDVLTLQDVLDALKEVNLEHYEIFALRGLLGRSTADVAADLAIDETTVRRRWRAARAWVERAVQGKQAANDSQQQGS